MPKCLNNLKKVAPYAHVLQNEKKVDMPMFQKGGSSSPTSKDKDGNKNNKFVIDILICCFFSHSVAITPSKRGYGMGKEEKDFYFVDLQEDITSDTLFAKATAPTYSLVTTPINKMASQRKLLELVLEVVGL